MRIVGKFKDKEIRLDSLHMDKTYGGFLSGPSANRMEEWNTDILRRLEGDTCRKLFGEGRPVDLDDADVYFTPRLRPEQRRPV